MLASRLAHNARIKRASGLALARHRSSPPTIFLPLQKDSPATRSKSVAQLRHNVRLFGGQAPSSAPSLQPPAVSVLNGLRRFLLRRLWMSLNSPPSSVVRLSADSVFCSNPSDALRSLNCLRSPWRTPAFVR